MRGLALAVAGLCLLAATAHASWQEFVGGPRPINHAAGTTGDRPSLADVGGTLYVAWEEYDGTHNEVHVSRLNPAGTAWTEVGSGISHTPGAAAVAPDIADVGGVPYVTWTEYDATSSKVRVAKLNGAGTGWTEVVGGANPINHDATKDAGGSSIADIGGVPYVTWTEVPGTEFNQSRVRVAKLNGAGTAWTEVVGGANPINKDPDGQTGGPRLASIGGVPYVAWQEGYGDPRIHVDKLNGAGTAWTEVGSGPAPLNHDPTKTSDSPDLIGIDGTPYVAWREANDLTFDIRAAKMNSAGTGWIELAASAPIGGSASSPNLTSLAGVPYVAYSQYDNNEEVRVSKLNSAGTAWEEVDGGPSPINEDPDGDGLTPSLTIFNGLPTVAWSQEEETTPQQIRVSRDVGDVWDRAWGQNVDSATPGTGFEICAVAANCATGTFGGTAPGAANSPEQLAVGPDGDVYVPTRDDQLRGLINKYDASGNFLTSWGGDGTTGGKFNGLPFGVAVDGSGHVYVADTRNNRVQEFTDTGAFVRAWGWGVNGGSGFEVCTVAASCVADTGHGEGGGLQGPVGIAVDGSGHVYIAEDDNRRVQKFTVTPSSVTFDRAWGADVVAGGGTGAEVCTVAANCKAGITGAGQGGETGRADAIAVDPAGDVYVAEGENTRIEEFTPAGSFVRAVGKGVNGGSAGEICSTAASCHAGQIGAGEGEFALSSKEAGLGFRPSGLLYVADAGNDRIQVLAPDGSFVRAFGTPAGHLGGQLAEPHGVAPGPGDTLYVSDTSNRRIQKFLESEPVMPAVEFQFSAATYSVDEFFGAAEIRVERTGDVAVPASVHYATSNGTATAGADYTAASGTLSFAAGETEKIFTVPMRDDQVLEPNETVNLTLSAPSPGTLGSPSTAVLTIVDDDALNTTITGGPDGVTVDKRPTFTFTSTPTGAQFQCRIDTSGPSGWSSCTSPWQVPANLSDGYHSIEVRAVTGGPPPTQVDPSPAVRVINVDTQAPTTTLTLTALNGAETSPGSFVGPVRVDGTQVDPAPGVPGNETRCALDPATPPATFYDLPSTLCPVATDAVGQHTVYAASRDLAGNAGPVVSKSFKVLSVADTIIDSGPSGLTYLKTPYFGFHATVGGSTFECRIDGAAYAPCTNPFLSGALAPGSHSFDVRAISPDGVPDSTPAHREFNIGGEVSHTYDCSVQPFTNTRSGVDWDPPPRGCDIAHPAPWSDADHCGVIFVCVDRDLHCPQFTLCTLTTNAQWYDADHGLDWWANALARIGFDTSLDPDQEFLGVTCRTGFDGDRCHSTAADTDIVVPYTGPGVTVDPSITGYADALCDAFIATSSPPVDYGSSQVRRIECTGTVHYEPLSALSASASGGNVSIFVPGAGLVTLSPGATPTGPRAGRRSGKAGKPAFKTQTTQSAGDGLVSFKPKLGKKAKKKLRKHRKLKLAVTVSYTSPDGTHATQASKVTLTVPQKWRGPKKLANQIALP